MVATDSADAEMQSALATVSRTFDVDTLRDMTTFDDALAALNAQEIPLRDASEHIGDGFELLDDKEKGQLVGVKFVILDASESPGDFGKSFVTVRLMTKDGRKCIVNDGSTGIRDQVVQVLQRYGSAAGFVVNNGLRASQYAYCESCKAISKAGSASCNACGHSPLSPAVTYYLDTSK